MNKRIFKNQTNTNSGVPFYKIGTFGKKADAFISKKLFEEYRKKYPYPKKGDLLISASGSIGRVIEYTGQQAYYQDSNIVWLNHNDNLENIYLKAYYQIIHWSGIEGSTIKRLYNKNILNTKIYVPIKDEQFKVGTIIDQIEKLITLQQRKLKLLNKLKKGLINNILSSVLHFTSTKSVEHIVTFGDIFNYERPDNYIVSSENYVSSGIPVLTANKSFILGYSNENHPYNKGKAIIFDDFTLESKLVNFNFMVKSSAIKILTTKPSYDIDFCFVLLKNTPLIQEGHARHYISRVQPTKVKVPNLTLQRKYAKIFNTLEYKIRNSNSIQENLKLLKQFLLQNMFI